MGSGYDKHSTDKGLFSHLGGGYHPPPPVAYPYHAQPYPPPYGGYPPHLYPPPAGYPPPVAYHGPSAPCYPGHGHHGHGLGTFLAGGVAAVTGACGGHHRPHHGSYGYYAGHHHHHHHGKFKRHKWKRAKFGKRWKHKMWK